MGGGGTLARGRWPLKIAACTGVGEHPDIFPHLDMENRGPYTERLFGGSPPDHFFTPGQMAEKKARTAEKGGEVTRKRPCPSCGGDSRVLQFAGYGPRGFFWVCEKNCGYTERTR
jgi:hypothetical protein